MKQKKEYHQTMDDAVIAKFAERVLRVPLNKVNTERVLGDYSEDKRFTREFVDMFLDRIQVEFGINLKTYRNSKIKDLLKMLVKRKVSDSVHHGKKLVKRTW